jgi:hypothetical protein
VIKEKESEKKLQRSKKETKDEKARKRERRLY